MRRIAYICMKMFIALMILVCTAMPLIAADPSSNGMHETIEALQKRFSSYGWNDLDITPIPWEYHRTTVEGRPLFFAQFGSGVNCTLFIGAVHGDELPTLYLLSRLAMEINNHPDKFQNECIIIAPLANPDGFFAKQPQRVNSKGIDVNRNFPTKDWDTQAIQLWKKRANSSKRYYPGSKSGSEQETLFQMTLIKRYAPQKILTIHSPLGFYDFDGNSTNLEKFGEWVDSVSKETQFPLKKYGTFPGSLGNYAGNERNILTLTLELPTSNPADAHDYYNKFYPAFLKYINLTLPESAPN